MADANLSAPPRRKPFLRGCLTVLLVLGAFFALLLIISRMDELPLARGEKVAVISVSGLISDSEPTIEQLKKFTKDDSVKAIVLRIDSPGGGVGPSQEIYEEVKKARAKKPVLASMGALAASGGYYIACAAQRVYANPGTITGSIGVIMPFMNVKDLVEKIGVKGMTVKSGVFKDIGSPMRDMTPQERELLQGVVDNVHLQFVTPWRPAGTSNGKMSSGSLTGGSSPESRPGDSGWSTSSGTSRTRSPTRESSGRSPVSRRS
jgi:signal peptide peptidase SppA, 36K type